MTYCFYIVCFCYILRDRSFNLKGEGGGYDFLFRSEYFFRTTRELEYLFFLSRKARIFFPDINIRLYDKNSESDYFFFLHQNQNIFFRKKPQPPLQVKLWFPNMINDIKNKLSNLSVYTRHLSPFLVAIFIASYLQSTFYFNIDNNRHKSTTFRSGS